MARRNVSESTKELFKQHGKTMGQPLSNDEAKTLLETDYKLTTEEATDVFEIFDSDQNGLLSMWEFEHFSKSMGHKARAMLDLFNKLRDEGSGDLDMDKAFDTLKAMKKEDGSPVSESELGMRLKAYAGEEKRIDRRKFINMLCCLKLDLP